MYNLVKLHGKPGTKMPWGTIFSEFNKFKTHADILRVQSLKNAIELHSKTPERQFLFMKDVERWLQKQFPKQYIEAHALLAFTNIPLLTCGRQIEVQENIARTLSEGKSDLEEIDLELAHNLIKQLCCPNLYEEKMWYETKPLPNISYLETLHQIRQTLGKPRL